MDFSPLTVTEALASKSYEKIAHICDHLLLQANYSSSFVVVVVVVVRATWYSVNVVWTGCGRGRCLWGRLALLLYSSSRPHLRWWYVCFFFFFFFLGNLTIQCFMLLTLVDVSHVFVREAFAFIISWFYLLGHCH